MARLRGHGPITGVSLNEALEDRPRLRALLSLWRDKAGTGLPAWADFDVLELRQWMGNLNVVVVQRQPFSFRYKVFGTNIARDIAAELTNHTFEDLKGRISPTIVESYRHILDHPEPTLWYDRQPALDDKVAIYDRLLLPMAQARDSGHPVLVGAYRQRA